MYVHIVLNGIMRVSMMADYKDQEERDSSQWEEAMAQKHCESCGRKFRKTDQAYGKLHSLGRIEKVCKDCISNGHNTLLGWDNV